jgi:hypothetical protein
MSYTPHVSESHSDTHDIAIASYKRMFDYLRIMGKAVGIFLIGFSFFIPARTEYAHPILSLWQAGFYVLYGFFLLFPEGRFSQKLWKRFFVLFIILTVCFVFIQVFDTLFQSYLAQAVHSKAFPPILQSMLVFFTLLQIPTILFRKQPNLLF